MNSCQKLIVLGGGEHARVVIETARSRQGLWNCIGFVDPQQCQETAQRLGIPRLGEDDTTLANDPRFSDCQFVLGVGSIGSSKVREDIVCRTRIPEPRWATIVHERAWVSPSAKLGHGIIIAAEAVVNAGAWLEAHTVINSACVIEHDVRIGAFSQVAPGAIIGGGTQIGESAYLGLGCRVRDHIRLGPRVTVGMGAVVLRDVASGEVVVGVPARPIRARSNG